MRFKTFFGILFGIIFLASGAFASIGKFSALSGDVTIIENGKAVKATMQSQIDKSDAIKTGKDGKAQIVFKDNTIITLGINSDFAIEEYFQDAKAPKAQFSINSGTFKALTGAMGKINPEGFKLKTKTATIGIRGTGILGQTGGNEEKIACTQGGISVTTEQGTVNVDKGQVTSFAPGQPPAAPKAFTPAEQQGMEEDSGMNEMPSDTATQESAGGIEAGAAATEEGAAGEGTAEEGTAAEGTTAENEENIDNVAGFDAEPEALLGAGVELVSDVLLNTENQIVVVQEEVNRVDNDVIEDDREENILVDTSELETVTGTTGSSTGTSGPSKTYQLPSVTSSYTSSVSGSVVDGGVRYAVETENSYLVLGFDLDNENLYGVLNLAYTDNDGIYKVWTVNVFEDDGTLTPEFTALSGGLSGGVFGTDGDEVDGSFDITQDGKTATGTFDGTKDATLGLQLYSGISTVSNYLNKRKGATPDGLYAETYYGSSGFDDDYFSLKVPNSSHYFSGDHTLALLNSYGAALGKNENADISGFVTRTPTSSYTGGIVESWTKSGYVTELVATDSMMEYFIYFSRDNSNNFLTKDSIVAMGIETLPSQLPSDGVYAYSKPDMDAAYSGGDMSLQLDSEDTGYINWKNSNMLHSKYDPATGTMQLTIGKVLADGSVSLQGKKYEFTTDSGIFTSGSTLDAAMFGSRQQGLVITSEMTGASGTTELGISPMFRNLDNSRASSSSASGTQTLTGFTSATLDYGNSQPWTTNMDVTLALGKDKGAVPVSGTIQYDSDTINLSSTEGMSAYIDDGQFASVALSGSLDGYSVSEEGHGYLVAVDNDDYVSWGYWAQKDMKSGTETLQVLPSMWIAGELTPQEYISNITTANQQASYSGDVMGSYISPGNVASALKDATFDMDVDFSNGDISGTFYNLASGWSPGYSGSASGNTFSGDFTGGTNTGSLRGGFYGTPTNMGEAPPAVGGSFYVNDGNQKATGIFRGGRQIQ